MAKRGATTPRAIDAVIQAAARRRRAVEVPEWGLTLWFSPVTTADRIAVSERMGDRKDVDSEAYRLESQILLLITKAELEDGSPAFSFGDKEYLLRKADYLVIQRLIAELYRVSIPVPTVDEAKGSSERTASSGSG